MRDKRLLRPSVSGRPVRSAAAARASAPGDTLADRVLRFEAYTGMPTYEFGVLAPDVGPLLPIVAGPAARYAPGRPLRSSAIWRWTSASMRSC
jgi:hypothetical protein